jgi:hypothetical protein
VPGNAPDYKFFDLVKVKRKDETRPVRMFDDYLVTVDSNNFPNGVFSEVLISTHYQFYEVNSYDIKTVRLFKKPR